MSASPIDVWWFRLDPDAEHPRGPEELLDQEERARFRRFKSAEAARFFAFRRAARRVILSAYLSEDPASLRFVEEAHGKPSVLPVGKLHFSASHTGTTGIVAVASDMPIGVDVEGIQATTPAWLSERILSPCERSDRERTAPSQRAAVALRAWTGKEALVKGFGVGLDLGAFRQATLALDSPPGHWKAARFGAGLTGWGSWHICEVPLDSASLPEVTASVAAPSPRPINLFDATGLLRRHGLT